LIFSCSENWLVYLDFIISNFYLTRNFINNLLYFLPINCRQKYNLFEPKASKEKLLLSQRKLIFISFFIN